MKLKTLAALCKREGAFCLYDRVNEDGEVKEQWLGTAAAAFPLSGIPRLTEENLCTLFDITEKQRNSIFFRHHQLPVSLNFDDTDEGEEMLERGSLTMNYHGRTIRPLFTSSGLEFIDTDHLEPLADVSDTLEIFERRTADGGIYFAAKTGLLLVGVIMHLNIIEDGFVEHLEMLARQCRTSLNRDKARAAEREKKLAENVAAQTEIKGQ